jgi:hypothetical protein
MTVKGRKLLREGGTLSITLQLIGTSEAFIWQSIHEHDTSLSLPVRWPRASIAFAALSATSCPSERRVKKDSRTYVYNFLLIRF